MKPWGVQRGSAEEPGFVEDVKALGTDMLWLWDETQAGIGETLRGAERERLDLVYPPRVDGLRLALTDTYRGFPPVTVAFYLDDEETVVFVSLKLRFR